MKIGRIALIGLTLGSLTLAPCLGQERSRHGAALRPLSEITNPDGTLRLEKGLAGSFDPRGYRMVAEPGQAPRFVPSSTKSVGRQVEPGLSAPDNGYWDGKFGISGVGGPVEHLAAGGSTLYAVGDFAGPPGMPFDHFAQWDGEGWSAFGSGLEVDWSYYPRAFAVSGETVYFAGYRSTETGVEHFLAKWDGTSWSPIPCDAGGIQVLAASGDILYAGGYFTAVGAVSAKNIAKWDGSAWSALGSGTNSIVHALAVSGDVLYVGGDFTSAGGVPNTSRIAKWDTISGTWSALGTGMNSCVRSLAAGDDILYAGGDFTTAGGVAAVCVAQWDGDNWSALGPGLGGDYVNVNEIATGGSILYVSGYFSIDGGVTTVCLARWDGSNWSALSEESDYQPHALATSGSTLYVGGSFYSYGGVPANYIARWNGTWTDVDSAENGGTNGEVNALAVSGSTVYVAGYFTHAGDVLVNGIAMWDGVDWSPLGTGLYDSEEYSIDALAVSGNTLYAGGYFQIIGGIVANNIAKWDGSNWSALGSGIIGEEEETVEVLAVNGNFLYVGGDFFFAGGVMTKSIAKWDVNTSIWSALGSGLGGDYPATYALAVTGSNLYVGGWFTDAGGIAATGLAMWNEETDTWSAPSPGLGGDYPYVEALAVSGSTLYVGGDFDSAGGVGNTAGIAQWNGSTWSALGPGLVRDDGYRASVSAMAVSDTALYVVGQFDSAGGVELNHIAKWDGTTWSALGTGMDEGYADCLAVLGSDLYVGGGFREVGDISSANIALWHPSLSIRKDDLLGTWDGQGVYYRNSDTGAWVKMASPATMITTGDLDGDSIDDLIGLWPTQGGIWVKYSSSGAWAKLSSTAKYICSGDMNGDGRVDLVGTWDGQGVYYRDSLSGAWVKMASPATMVTAGDIDDDGTDDLIGLWPSQGGIWVKYSQTGAWAKLSSTAVHIAAGDMNGDGRDDLLGTWDGQGAYYRDSVSGAWIKMASPATLITTGDIDGDATDDLIGIWPSQGGVWVKYSDGGTWERLSSTAQDITAGKMRAAGGGSAVASADAWPFPSMTMELPLPMGGFAEGPEGAFNAPDLSGFGPGGPQFLFKQQKNLMPTESPAEMMKRSRKPGPGEFGFRSAEQKNLVPQGFEKRELKKTDKKK